MTPEILLFASVAITAFGLSIGAVWAVLRKLTLDHPNDRSSHTIPTPRGGGLGVIPAILLPWILFAPDHPWTLIVGALLLMAGSWIDDRRGLPPLTRLLAQAAMAALFIIPLNPGVLLGLALGFILVWFINLYNFMDGIDGISGVETASLGLGIVVVCLISRAAPNLILPALCLTGASLGFLVWNWHPAKVFLGDCGSIPLGLLMGGLLILLALAGQWSAAIILPAYYLADATITLTARMLNGEKIWQAHRKHFYQKAARGGAGPAKVSKTVLGGNLGLIGCAALTANGHQAVGLAAAALVLTGLLAMLYRWGKNAPP